MLFAISLKILKRKHFSHQLNSKLFPVVCCYGWQGWTWIETTFQLLINYYKFYSKQLIHCLQLVD